MPLRHRAPRLTVFPAALVALAVLLGAACTVPAPTPRSPRATPQDRQWPGEPDHGEWGERLLVEAVAIPGAWLTRDLDGVADNPDAVDAAGYGVRAGIGNRDQSIGVLAQAFHGDADALDAATLCLDMDVRTALDRYGPRGFFARAGAGLGAGWLDVPGDDPGGEATAQLRLGIDFQPTRLVLVSASFGGIVFGHPGETEAYGTFLTIGGGLTF